MPQNSGGIWQTALYCRLSREDGDRPESDSIGNQRKLLEEYVATHLELVTYDCYADASDIVEPSQEVLAAQDFSGLVHFLCALLRATTT